MRGYLGWRRLFRCFGSVMPAMTRARTRWRWSDPVGLFGRHAVDAWMPTVMMVMLCVAAGFPSPRLFSAAGWGHHVDAAQAVAGGSGADGAGSAGGVPWRGAGGAEPGWAVRLVRG